MSILGINFLNVSITALVVIYVFVCLSMILLVLMQRPKQEGLGAAFGANATDQLFGARTTNVLQKGTVYMAVLFFLLTLGLAILVQKKNQIVSLAKAPAAAEAPAAPVDEPTKSLSEELPVQPATPVPAEGDKPVEPTTPEKPAEEKPAEEKPAEAVTPEKPAEDKPAEADKTPEP
jgi:preprotein translocase subunit SecG